MLLESGTLGCAWQTYAPVTALVNLTSSGIVRRVIKAEAGGRARRTHRDGSVSRTAAPLRRLLRCKAGWKGHFASCTAECRLNDNEITTSDALITLLGARMLSRPIDPRDAKARRRVPARSKGRCESASAVRPAAFHASGQVGFGAALGLANRLLIFEIESGARAVCGRNSCPSLKNCLSVCLALTSRTLPCNVSARTRRTFSFWEPKAVRYRYHLILNDLP